MFHCRSISHHHTELAIREQLSLTPHQQQQWMEKQHDVEVVVLSTCNRLELYAHVDEPDQMDTLWADLLTQQTSPTDVPYTLSLTGLDAVRHLFRVCCGLESMALGEPQILGQVTRAYEQAHAQGTAHNAISLLFRAAIHAAKRARTETNIGTGSASVSSLAVSKIEAALGPLNQHSAIVLGAGEMGQTVIKTLLQRGATQITVISRTYESARRAAEQWQIRARPITELKDSLLEAGILFTTSNAPFTILSSEDVEPIMRARPERPLYIVDIAVPRDVDMAVGSLTGVCLYDLDDLQQVIEASIVQRRQTIPEVERIIEEELSLFWSDYQGRTVAPTIRQLREQAERIRQAELNRMYHRVDDEHTRELVEQFSHRFMNKMLHHLTRNLRDKAGQQDGALLVAIARDLFGLEDGL